MTNNRIFRFPISPHWNPLQILRKTSIHWIQTIEFPIKGIPQPQPTPTSLRPKVRSYSKTRKGSCSSRIRPNTIWVWAINGRAASRWTKIGPFLRKISFDNRFKSFIYIFLLQIGLIKSRFHYFKHPNLDIPWFLDFRSPGTLYLFISLYQKTSKSTRKSWEHLGKYYFHIWEFGNPKLWHFSKRRAPQNDEDPSKNFLKILNMGQISTWRHEMIFWEYLKPFWNFGT